MGSETIIFSEVEYDNYARWLGPNVRYTTGMKEKLRTLWAKKWFKILLGVIVLLIIISLVRGGNDEEITTATVIRDGLVQEVFVQGTVTPASDIELAFDDSGVVARVNVDVGDEVVAGSVLASLGNGDVLSSLEEARADRDAAVARLNELQLGTRDEEIRVQERRVDSAESAVADAEDGLNDALGDAISEADDAVRNKLDRFFKNPASIPQIRIGKTNSIRNQVEDRRKEVEDILDRWDELVFTYELTDQVEQIQTELELIIQMINGIALLAAEEDVSSDLSQAEYDTNISIVDSAQDNVSDGRSAIIAAEEKYTAAVESYEIELEELELLNAGFRSEVVAAQEAVVASRQAAVGRRYAEYQKTIITAPIDGVIVRREIDPGESVSAYESVLKIISAGTLQVEADISELDVSLVHVGDVVDVTLDAYGDNEIFTGTVVQVDPAETVVDNLPTYGIVIEFTDLDARIRSGMTANIRIITDEKESVLTLPGAAVVFDQGETVVFLGNPTNPERRVVETGTFGSDGSIEIISGVSEGEVVLIR